MKKIFGVVLVLIIVLTAFLGYRSYKRSPLYSLKQAGIALKTGDTETAKKYIDFGKIINGVFEEAISKDEEIKNNPFAAGMVEMFRAPMVAAIQTAIFNAIEEGVKKAKEEENNNAQSAPTTQRKNNLIKKVKVVTKKKDFATVQIIFSGEENKKDMPLIVGMQKTDNYWQAVKIMNFDEIKDADFWD